jgi:hypothetical protein
MFAVLDSLLLCPKLFPTAGFQIITELGSIEDSPWFGRAKLSFRLPPVCAGSAKSAINIRVYF